MKLELEVVRGGHVESLHQAVAVVLDEEDRRLDEGGWPIEDPQVFWRSAAKPLQALPLIESGAAERFSLPAEAVALACGSHSGGDEHVAVAAAVLQRIGASEDDLYCGAHPPLGEAEARVLAARGGVPTRLHNNCSGKHAAMLAACRAKGWPLRGYQALEHPLQQAILDALAQVAEVPRPAIGTAVDGCGAVVFRTPLSALARVYRRFAAAAWPGAHGPAGARLLAALRQHPVMLAGEGRLCTDLLRLTGGRVIGKVGAEGMYVLASAAPAGDERARALALKVEDGAGRAVYPLVLALAGRLGMLTAAELAALAPRSGATLTNHQNEVVGLLRPRL